MVPREAERPASTEAAAERLRALGGEGTRVRPVGGGTKPWGGVVEEEGVVLSTAGLDGILEHNEGDLTAVLEAGVPLARAQETFEAAGQMMALDPPLGARGEATVGGIVAAGDSGPLRHRYGGPRDLVIGVRLALSDGTVARAGGKVIKNVAGYDLAKLLTGSFGTLGLLLEVSVRLHPRSQDTATARGRGEDVDRLAAAAGAMAHARMEMSALDVRREAGGSGEVLARFGGSTGPDQAGAALGRLRERGLDADVVEDDAGLWEEQRAGQRSSEGAVVRVSAVQSELPRVLRAAEGLGGSVVGRAALGLSWVRLEGGAGDLADAVGRLRAELSPWPCVLCDAPPEVRGRLDPWGVAEGPELELMRRMKARFDPAGVCNAGVYVGGI